MTSDPSAGPDEPVLTPARRLAIALGTDDDEPDRSDVPLTFLALAYARVLSWWIAPLPLLTVPLLVLTPPTAIAVVLSLASWAPAYVLAHQLVTGRRRASA